MTDTSKVNLCCAVMVVVTIAYSPLVILNVARSLDREWWRTAVILGIHCGMARWIYRCFVTTFKNRRYVVNAERGRS